MAIPWLAIQAGAALAGQAASIFGQTQAVAEGSKARKATRRHLRESGRQGLLEMRAEKERLIGTQRTSYAAAGVAVDRGSAAVILRETQEEFKRREAAFTTQYVSDYENVTAPRMDWFGAAGLTSSIAQAGDAWANRPRTVGNNNPNKTGVTRTNTNMAYF